MPAESGIAPSGGATRSPSAGLACHLDVATLAVRHAPTRIRPRREAETDRQATAEASPDRLIRSRNRHLLASDLKGGSIEVIPRDSACARRCPRAAGDRNVERGGDRVGQAVMSERGDRLIAPGGHARPGGTGPEDGTTRQPGSPADLNPPFAIQLYANPG
jgi:hypothetical protein